MESHRKICKTVFKKSVIDDETSTSLYNMLKNTIEWEDGIRSIKGYTRKAKSLNIGDIPEVDEVITLALSALTTVSYRVDHIYLNYYETNEMWTPSHTHKGTHQLIISLGDSRTLTINKTNYFMENGDVVIFGSAAHGIPKQETPSKGRISIATFMVPV